MLTGPSAQELGVRVLYNMPQPTHIQLWDGQRNILQKFTSAGWTGGAPATKKEKTVNLSRVKAELGFSAADYFSMVYEKITAMANVNMDDLSGTDLEQAETTLFRQALAENIRATMWIGDTTATSGYNTFDGFLKQIKAQVDDEVIYNFTYQEASLADPAYVVELFDKLWNKSDLRVQDLKADGQLAFFVTSDLCHLYEKYLDSKGADAAYTDTVNGRRNLAYHGIPVIDLRLGGYLAKCACGTIPTKWRTASARSSWPEARSSTRTSSPTPTNSNPTRDRASAGRFPAGRRGPESETPP